MEKGWGNDFTTLLYISSFAQNHFFFRKRVKIVAIKAQRHLYDYVNSVSAKLLCTFQWQTEIYLADLFQVLSLFLFFKVRKQAKFNLIEVNIMSKGQFPLKENYPWKSKWSNFIGWNWWIYITTDNFLFEEIDLNT